MTEPEKNLLGYSKAGDVEKLKELLNGSVNVNVKGREKEDCRVSVCFIKIHSLR